MECLFVCINEGQLIGDKFVRIREKEICENLSSRSLIDGQEKKGFSDRGFFIYGASCSLLRIR